MSYQQNILKKYREIFPKKPLRVTSQETGINLTRVFRIFNGSEMKISEFEAFENVLNNKNNDPAVKSLANRYIQSLGTLSELDARLLEIELNHLSKIDAFVNRPSNSIVATAAL